MTCQICTKKEQGCLGLCDELAGTFRSGSVAVFIPFVDAFYGETCWKEEKFSIKILQHTNLTHRINGKGKGLLSKYLLSELSDKLKQFYPQGILKENYIT